jgi:hypothetical protein
VESSTFTTLSQTHLSFRKDIKEDLVELDLDLVTKGQIKEFYLKWP